MNNSTGPIVFEIAPALFGWLDFSVFGLMLITSVSVGIYYGFFNKQITKLDYLLGGKSMSIIPVALSLVSCHISGVTVMGVPSEVYRYGSLYTLVCLSCILTSIIMNYVYLPVFFELQITSTYEYLEMRFSRSVRVMASVLYSIAMLMYMPIVVYVPALAFSQVSGLSVHYITPAVCTICIFYSMLGGFKAVVWSDVIQMFIMVGSSVAVMFMGLHAVGGVGTVFKRGSEGGRINIFDMNPNPMVRSSFWTVLIGTTFLRSANMVNQGSVQRFLSLPRGTSGAKLLVIYCIGIIFLKLLSIFIGLVIYAAYYDCDPITTKAVKRADQLLAYFVMDTAGDVPGFPGIFISGVFSASISSVASGLNCLSATVFEDLVRPWLKQREDDRRDNFVLKTIVLILGSVCVFLVLIVEKLGGVLEISYSAQGVTCGALLGLFSLGIYFPWANAKGALIGGISSLVLVSWIVYGAQSAIASGRLIHKTLPTSVEGCGYNVTSNTSIATEPLDLVEEEPFVLFRVSYWYYGVIGTFTVIVVGMLVSVMTGLQDPNEINIMLIAPFLRNFARRKGKISEEVVELTDKDSLFAGKEETSGTE